MPELSTSPVPDPQLFRDAFNASPIGIVVENMDGQPLFVNPAFCSFLGFTEEELRSKHCVDFSPAEDAEKDWALFQQLKAGTIDHYQLDKRYFRKNGSLVWGRLSISLLNSRPSPLVIAIVEDITAQKKAEDAVRNSEERLRLSRQVACIGCFDRDVQTGILTWTPEMESLYGLPTGSFGGTRAAFENLVHPDDRARVVELLEAALQGGGKAQGEWRIIWPDGSVHWIAGTWQVLRDDSGEPSQVVGVNIDVTERKDAEQALHAREELLKIFVKNVPAAVAMLDRDMRYLQVSDRWCSDNSVEASALLGRLREELPEMPERWKEINRRALQGEILRADEDSWESGGSTRWCRWEVRPWRNPDGTVGGILILAEDITQRKQAEESLAGMSRKLIDAQEQERMRIARELHDDINQRLALLSVELESSRQNPPETPTDVSILVTEVLQRINEISWDVQSLSHQLHSSQLEYLGIVSATRSFCREFSTSQNVEIDFEHDDIPRPVSPEISLCLFRVLQEALHNAVKYSQVRHVEVRLSYSEHQLHLTVSDRGVGFDQSAVNKGGLGLVSMRERVRLVNGTISIQAKPMGGTTIHVQVPFLPEDSSQEAAG